MLRCAQRNPKRSMLRDQIVPSRTICDNHQRDKGGHEPERRAGIARSDIADV